MRPPLAFVYGNCVFAEGVSDAWAAFAVGLDSYAWLDREEKRARLLAIVGALEAAEADVQLLRIGGRWNVDFYGADLDSADSERAVERERYVESQRAGLRERSSLVPGLYMLVSLREPEADVASYISRLATRSRTSSGHGCDVRPRPRAGAC